MLKVRGHSGRRLSSQLPTFPLNFTSILLASPFSVFIADIVMSSGFNAIEPTSVLEDLIQFDNDYRPK